MSRISANLIPLYNTPPSGSILVEELQHIITLRHEILHNIESKIQTATGDYKYSFLIQLIQKYEDDLGWSGAIENDKNSHFILSLAFCKSDQDRLWFANLESKLFMGRLTMYEINLEEVLRMLSIPLEKQENISTEIMEKIKFRERSNSSNSHSIYRIPFEYAFNLIPTMQYFLNKGYVYITVAEIFQLVETVFKEKLIKKLIHINRNLDRILNDSRIAYLIKDFQAKRDVETLSKSFTNVSSENISYKDIEAHVERSFPLCMQLIHKTLTKESHLRHIGRLQYGLFLKGIGLSMDESLNFWKTKFASKTPGDKFDKDYAYNIRHSYGKEGKRNDYIPYSCNRIQNLPIPSSAETHGCPFKLYSEEKLKSIMFEMKFKELDVLKVMEKKRNNEWSVSFFI